MNLMDLLNRQPPAPWTEGDNIPWNEPGFSQRMLQVHLSQEWDAASRRGSIIDQHVTFIHRQCMESRPGRILDLGCGPGLYAHRLARLGHTVHGIDFSPASIGYARETAEKEGLSRCTFVLSDLRQADFDPPGAYDLVMLLYGEFNVFRPEDVRSLFRKAHKALKPYGRLLLEPSPEGYIRKLGAKPAIWYTQETGIFADQPHLVLVESFWNEASRAATTRYYVVDLQSAAVTRHAASYQAYHNDDYHNLLGECGFDGVTFYPNLLGTEEWSEDFLVVLAEKV